MSEAASNPRNRLAAVEREFLEEIASQSGRYGERLDALLEEIAVLRQRVEVALAQRTTDGPPAGGPEELNACITHYNGLRRRAQQVQHYLIIHREAMGFWNHDDVFRCYPIPSSLTPL